MKKPPTYERIECSLDSSSGTFSRDHAALSWWMDVHEASFDDRADLLVADEETFRASLEGVLEGWRKSDGSIPSAASRKQRRAGLNALRRVALHLADAGETDDFTLPGAIARCRRSMRLNKQEVKRRYGPMFQEYEAGRKLPTRKKESVLRRFALDAGMPEDYLLGFIPHQIGREEAKVGDDRKVQDTYGLSTVGYKLPGMITGEKSGRYVRRKDLSELPECRLKSDFERWIAYKTEAPGAPSGLNKMSGSTWTYNASGVSQAMQSSLSAMNSFFGWLHNRVGVPIEQMTLAMAGDPVLLERFDRFCSGRGSPTRGVHAAQVCASLMMGVPRRDPSAGVVGFIRQQRRVYSSVVAQYLDVPEIRAMHLDDLSLSDEGQDGRAILEEVLCIENDCDDREEMEERTGRKVRDKDVWEAWCGRAHRRLSALSQKSGDERRPTGHRSPLQKVKDLIDATPERRERPIRVASDMMYLINRDKEINERVGNETRAFYAECNLFTVALAVALPVREYNARHIRLHPELLPDVARRHLPHDYKPNLWRDEDGTYWFQEHREYFKTREAMSRKGIEYYTVPLPSWFTPILHRYLHEVRPWTAGGLAGSPYLHVCLTRRHNQSDEDLREALGENRLGMRMGSITKRYLVKKDLGAGNTKTPTGEGMRYHWVRHLVATDILATHPEALVFVAHVLNDDLETVRRAYDASRPADSMRFAGRHQDAVMKDVV